MSYSLPLLFNSCHKQTHTHIQNFLQQIKFDFKNSFNRFTDGNILYIQIQIPLRIFKEHF